MFSIEIITLSIVAVLNAMILWLVSSQGWNSIANRYFTFVTFFSIFWVVGTAVFFGAPTLNLARFGLLFFYIGPMLMILSLCLFATVFHGKKDRPLNFPNALFLVMTIVLAVLIINDQNFLTSSISLGVSTNNRLYVNPDWYRAYSLYFSYGYMIVFTQFFANIRRNTGYRRKQLVYIATAMGVVIAIATFTNILLPIFGTAQFIWIGPVCTFIAVIIITTAIVKHALFDVKLAAVRSAAYVLALITLATLYYLAAYFMSAILLKSQSSAVISVSPLNVILALILAFVFQPIKHFFDRLTNSVFYRNDYKSEDFFASISNLLTSTIDLRGLVEGSAKQIASTLKSEQVFFFLYYTNVSTHHMSAGTHGHAKVPLYDARLLDEFLATTTDKIIVTELLPEGSPVRRMLISHKVAVVMPLLQGENIAGYVMLGEHKSGSYRKRDFNVLLAVSSELVIAIQNALSLHEVKELNATLQQRINVATKELRSSNAQLKHLDEVKDEFMSMASHQLRTPLTSVKGYISMVLEGDAGNVTPKQQKLLVEAFKSSERMVGLIADFLNVSRLQTGKFIIDKTQFDLKDIVKQEVSDLEMIATSHDIKLRLKITNHPLPILADESKVRQVIMNYIDNAIYYSHPKGVIVINVDKLKDDAVLTVVDTGIGVPEDEQSRLFNKFFRAKNARLQRPDGTGVGLYLARRVISAHRGSLIFSSKEGKGSTFGFRIPLGKPIEQKVVALEPESETVLASAAK